MNTIGRYEADEYVIRLLEHDKTGELELQYLHIWGEGMTIPLPEGVQQMMWRVLAPIVTEELAP